MKHTTSIQSTLAKKSYIIKGRVVVGNPVKMVYQLDNVVHNASIVAKMVFGACVDMNQHDIFDIISRYFTTLLS